MSSAILINSMRLVDPFDLQDITFSAEELIRPLAKLCRYTGQTKDHFSVAEHTVHLINVVPAPLKRAAALHDLNEGLTNDMSRPFKRRMPNFVACEETVQRRIFQQFNEPWENMEAIAEYDFNICGDEMLQVFEEPWICKGTKPLGITIEFWDWRTAENNLRSAFKFLGLL